MVLHKVVLPALFAALLPQWAAARVTEYNLTIRREDVNITGKWHSEYGFGGGVGVLF